MPYCHNCGADLPPNAAFCAKCGAPAITTTGTTPSAPPTYRYGSGYEKREKQEKQTRQSAEKYEKREKGGDRTGPLIGGGILILLGLIYYATITPPPPSQPLIPSTQFWAYFFLGIGILLVIQAVYRFQTMHHHAAGMGSLWGGVILAAIGAAGIAGSGNFWPIILIAIGALVIVAGVTSRARAPRPP